MESVTTDPPHGSVEAYVNLLRRITRDDPDLVSRGVLGVLRALTADPALSADEKVEQIRNLLAAAEVVEGAGR